MHLFFVGMKHCGKSTFAPLIAEDAGMTCADSDDLLLMMPDITSVRSFYRTHGQEEFMNRELEAVENYLDEHSDGVLSLGGGAADNIPLMNLIKEKGKIVYLKRNEKLLLEKILAGGLPPFLDPSDPQGSFHAIYERRSRVYEEYADIIINLEVYEDIGRTKERIEREIKEVLDGGK